MADTGFTLNARIDTRDVERLTARVRETQQATESLKRTLSDLLTPAAQKRFEAFSGVVETAVTGGVTRRGMSDLRALGREVTSMIRQGYTERRQEIERQFQADESLIRARGRGTVQGLMTPLFSRGGGAPREEIHRARMEMHDQLLQNRRGLREAVNEQRVEEQAALRDLRTMQDATSVANAPDERGGGGRGGRGGGGSFLGRLFGGGAGRGAGGFARGLGIPLGFGTAGAGYLIGRGIVTQAASDEELYEGLLRRIGTPEEYLGGNMDEVRRRMFNIPGPGGRPMFGYGEAARAVGGYVGLAGAGRTSPEQFLPAHAAASVGFGMGLGPEGGADFFGNLARMGQIGQGRQGEADVRRIATLIGETIAISSMRGREPEMISSALNFMTSTLRTMVLPPDIEDVFRVQRRLVEGAPEALKAGMRGELGMRVLSTAQEAVAGTQLFPGIGANLMHPMLLMAMLQGGETDPFKMEEIRSQGIFGRLTNGTPVLDVLMDQFGPMIESGGFGALAAAQSFGFGANPGLFRRFLGAMQVPGMQNLAKETGFDQLQDTRRGPGVEIMERASRGEITFEAARQEMAALKGAGPTGIETFAQDRARLENTLTEMASRLTPLFMGLTDALNRALNLAEDKFGSLEVAGITIGSALIGGAIGEATGIPFGKLIGGAVGGAAGYMGGKSLYPEGGRPRISIDGSSTTGPGTAPGPQSSLGGGGAGGYMQGSTTYSEMGSRLERFYGAVSGLGVPDALARRIAMIESSSGTDIDPMTGRIRRSSKGAIGPVQGLPSTFRDYDPTITEEQMDSPRGDIAMAKHMARLYRKYGGDQAKVAAAWNAGEGRVDEAVKADGALWFTKLPDETRDFLKKFHGTESLGVPGGTGTSMAGGTLGSGDWVESLIRDGIKLSADPATIVLMNEEGVVMGRGEVQWRMKDAGTMHGPVTSPTAQ